MSWNANSAGALSAQAVATFFKTSACWVVDFRYDGRPRRWYRAFGPGVDVAAQMASELQQLHGRRAQLQTVRPATADEERLYLRGEEPKNMICPTGRRGPAPGTG